MRPAIFLAGCALCAVACGCAKPQEPEAVTASGDMVVWRESATIPRASLLHYFIAQRQGGEAMSIAACEMIESGDSLYFRGTKTDPKQMVRILYKKHKVWEVFR